MLKLNRRNFIKNTSLFALSSSFSQAYIMDAIAKIEEAIRVRASIR